MMWPNGTSAAYLVMAMKREGSALVVENETVCFDRDLAIAMAYEDSAVCAWVGVYALDSTGRCIQNGAFFSLGSLVQRRPPASGHRREPQVERAPSAP